MKRAKILSLGLAFALALILSACGNPDQEERNEEISAKTDSEVGISYLGGGGDGFSTFRWPLKNTDAGKIGYDYTEMVGSKKHSGIDIVTDAPIEVVAPYAGKVVGIYKPLEECNKPKTNCYVNAYTLYPEPNDGGPFQGDTISSHRMQGVIILEHTLQGGKTVYTLFAHLNKIYLSPEQLGQMVNPGDPLGKITVEQGSKIHLHFEIKSQPYRHLPYPIYINGSPSYAKWGYVPYNEEPDNLGYYDPILFFHNITDMLPPVYISVISSDTIRVGPGTNYRSIGKIDKTRGPFIALRETTSATPKCSSGWYQIKTSENEMFTDENWNCGKVCKISDAWVCADKVIILEGASAVSAGGSHTCALTSSGGVKCWGRNDSGQLGNGTTTDSKIPVNVSGLDSGVMAISAGIRSNTCTITYLGGAKCWGPNNSGQLGNGTNIDSIFPVDVSGLSSGTDAIAVGGIHTCAITDLGGAKCWGYNGSGHLGNGTNTNSNVPVNVSGLSSGVISITTGDGHSCALIDSGGVKCWGNNEVGQLGNGSISWMSNIPVNVSGLSSGVSAIDAGGAHTCVVTSLGAVKCWGWNKDGQLGNGTKKNSNIPVLVSGLSSGVSAISAGSEHTCALLTSGGVKCWGNNDYGQLGNGTNSSSNLPVKVSGLSSGVSAISAGGFHTCALLTSGGVKCWGLNGTGQLGNGTRTDSNVPVNVLGFGP